MRPPRFLRSIYHSRAPTEILARELWHSDSTTSTGAVPCNSASSGSAEWARTWRAGGSRPATSASVTRAIRPTRRRCAARVRRRGVARRARRPAAAAAHDLDHDPRRGRRRRHRRARAAARRGRHGRSTAATRTIVDDVRRAAALGERGVHYLDVGVSGGIFGLEQGYCLMIGGDAAAAARLDAAVRGARTGRRRRDRRAPAPRAHGYLHCGPSGAGHFVKMVHNGIEYGLMAAYAEGFNLLRERTPGTRAKRVDAETAPLHGARRASRLRLRPRRDRRAVAPRQRRSLVAARPHERRARPRPALDGFLGEVSDSGEGRWTVNAAVDAGVPGARARDGAVRALRLAQPRRLREPLAVGDAARVRRPRRAPGARRRK